MYDPKMVKRLSINPIDEGNLVRVSMAINGLTQEFGREWVETNLYDFDPAERSRELGISADTLIHQWAEFDDLVFLWEDLQTIRDLVGFYRLRDKLTQGRRANDVDLEIAIAADVRRLTGQIELEPSVGNGRYADLRFKCGPNSGWTYAEATRKRPGDVGNLLSKRGKTLAALVAARDPTRRQYVAVTRPMDPGFSQQEFEELLAWIPNRESNSSFKGYAFVGSVPHGEDETPLVLSHFPGPVSVRSHVDVETNSVGVAYIFVPDLGAEKKIGDKVGQATAGIESLLFIDLTRIVGAREHWDERIEVMDVARTFSAVVLLRSELGVQGYSRICNIVEPQQAARKLSEETRRVLEQFAELRVKQKLG